MPCSRSPGGCLLKGGSALGVPTRGGACCSGGACSGGCLLQGGGNPSKRTASLLLRTVRILLECILVKLKIHRVILIFLV